MGGDGTSRRSRPRGWWAGALVTFALATISATAEQSAPGACRGSLVHRDWAVAADADSFTLGLASPFSVRPFPDLSYLVDDERRFRIQTNASVDALLRSRFGGAENAPVIVTLEFSGGARFEFAAARSQLTSVQGFRITEDFVEPDGRRSVDALIENAQSDVSVEVGLATGESEELMRSLLSLHGFARAIEEGERMRARLAGERAAGRCGGRG